MGGLMFPLCQTETCISFAAWGSVSRGYIESKPRPKQEANDVQAGREAVPERCHCNTCGLGGARREQEGPQVGEDLSAPQQDSPDSTTSQSEKKRTALARANPPRALPPRRGVRGGAPGLSGQVSDLSQGLSCLLPALRGTLQPQGRAQAAVSPSGQDPLSWALRCFALFVSL